MVGTTSEPVRFSPLITVAWTSTGAGRLKGHHLTKVMALKLGAENWLSTNSRPKVPEIARAVDSGYVPIALVHMGVVHSLNIPHWVVVTDADERSVVFNDPYPPKGRKGLKLSGVKFQEILDDIGIKIGMSPSVLLVRNG